MNREQALRLWLSTLATREIPTGDGPDRDLLGVWDGVGLVASERAALAQALRAPDALGRREALVRATRRVIQFRGFDVDVLSTPAARMRGI